jgi:hypothetical protein
MQESCSPQRFPQLLPLRPRVVGIAASMHDVQANSTTSLSHVQGACEYFSLHDVHAALAGTRRTRNWLLGTA